MNCYFALNDPVYVIDTGGPLQLGDIEVNLLYFFLRKDNLQYI